MNVQSKIVMTIMKNKRIYVNFTLRMTGQSIVKVFKNICLIEECVYLKKTL